MNLAQYLATPVTPLWQPGELRRKDRHQQQPRYTGPNNDALRKQQEADAAIRDAFAAIGGPASVSDLAKHTGGVRKTVAAHLLKMHERGLVRRAGAEWIKGGRALLWEWIGQEVESR